MLINLEPMKNIIIISILFSTLGFSQTPINDANFMAAIRTCLSTNPVDGLCSGSQYGAMPSWDVSNVTNMRYTFHRRSNFNADISSWDVSNVTNMDHLFSWAYDFDQDLSSWDVSNVTNMEFAFYFADFDQDISTWDVSNVTTMRYILDNAGLSTTNYDALLIGWSTLNLQSNVKLDAVGIKFCDGAAAKQSMVDNLAGL